MNVDDYKCFAINNMYLKFLFVGQLILITFLIYYI